MKCDNLWGGMYQILAPQIAPLNYFLIYLVYIQRPKEMEATLRFELRVDTVNKKGEHPLILILRIAGQRKKVATGIKLFPELWNNESQQINNLTTKLKDFLKKKYGGDLPTKNELINYQETIYGLKNQVAGIESRFDYDGVTYSATMVVEALQKTKTSKVKKEDGANLIYDLIDKYIKENEHTRATGSLKVYKTLKRHLQNYQATTKLVIRPDQLDHAFVQSFQNFLINWE
ncbi:MAG: phage integrase SAM-like domain-containing protein [Cyclobacterium sp.]|uniref:phage integrase SAM-like domain-containing protein n=1 Tax=Cyclobacterium sp. TaxID=1966343 RepID=UPI003970DCAE